MAGGSGRPGHAATVASDGLPTAQIDGVAWGQIVVGRTVYVASKFTRARPAGAAAGVNTVSRNNLLAYDLDTGVLKTAFVPNLNAEALSSVNSIGRGRLAAVRATDGALLS